MKMEKDSIFTRLANDIAEELNKYTSIIEVPKNLNTDYASCLFFANLSKIVVESKHSKLLFCVLDCRNTESLSAGAITIIVNFMTCLHKKVFLWIQDDEKGEIVLEEGDSILQKIVEKYCKDCVTTALSTYNFKEERYQDFLNKKLGLIHYKNEVKMKIVLSELFANIQMHSKSCLGTVMFAADSRQVTIVKN